MSAAFRVREQMFWVEVLPFCGQVTLIESHNH